MSAWIVWFPARNFRISRWVIKATNKSPLGKKPRPNGRLRTSATVVTLPSRSMRKTFPARTSDTHRAPKCHLGALRRQNPFASTSVFSVFIILHHSSSFFIILHHSSSFFIILHHSSSFFIILHHSSSFFII